MQLIRHLAGAFALAVATLGTATAQETAEPAPVFESFAGTLRLRGFNERSFNPLKGTFVADTGADISKAEDAVTVLINDVPVDSAEITVGRNRVRVDYELESGVNDVLVMVRDRDGGAWRGDALVWAGDRRLTVDVVGADHEPLHDVPVVLTLADDAGVSARGRTNHGAVAFEHLPNYPLIVSVSRPQRPNNTVRQPTRGDAGSVLVELTTPER